MVDDRAKYISHREALRLFAATGLSDASFSRKVAEGKIEKRLPEGRQRGSLYREDQILEIVQKYEAKKRKKQMKKKKRVVRSLIQFRRMEIEEMPIVADILEELFDCLRLGQTITFCSMVLTPRWPEWLRRGDRRCGSCNSGVGGLHGHPSLLMSRRPWRLTANI